jgi:maltokinase
VPLLDDLAEKLAPLLRDFLPRQRWFTGDEPPARTTVTVLEASDGDPLLAWLLVDAVLADGTTATYQLVLGGRRDVVGHDFLHGKERVTVGQIDGVTLYDALVDPELALAVLEKVAPGQSPHVARPLLVEQSNTSVVFDERLILKLFRRIYPQANPDVEIPEALAQRGFPNVVPQIDVLRRDGADLAVVREYQLGATDAWALAHTSLRDLLGTPLPPEEAGADFGPEAFALGEVVGRLHLALADAFGSEPGVTKGWLEGFHAQLDRLRSELAGRRTAGGEPVGATEAGATNVDAGAAAADILGPGELDAVARVFDEAHVEDAGMSLRIHGDLHLGQILLADTGWFVLDFEGEPARPVGERRLPSSPLRDVAGMLRSFHYATQTALGERGRDIDAELIAVADAWEERAAEAFRRGYTSVEGIASLLPADEAGRHKLLRAFELDKAVYEVLYELGHRPDWVDIPASAIRRALARV